jgi:hypothetical protein
MQEAWSGNMSFDLIILDYFFLPAGWAAHRWTQKFFSDTLPTLVEWGILKPGGSLWLPHVSHTEEMVSEFSQFLANKYDWELVSDPMLNPLYSATERVTDLLIEASPKAILTNATQLPYLLQQSKEPFYKFTAKILESTPQSTPSKKRPQMSPKTATSSTKKRKASAVSKTPLLIT